MAQTGSSEIPEKALNMAIMTRTATDSPREIVKAARKYEDYLRGDRDYNDRLTSIIDAAVDMSKMWQSGVAPSQAAMDELVARVNRVKEERPS